MHTDSNLIHHQLVGRVFHNVHINDLLCVLTQFDAIGATVFEMKLFTYFLITVR